MKSLPFSKLNSIPIHDIRPTGWLLDFLSRQSNGLTGNVEVSGYPYGYKFWGSKDDDTKGSYDVWWPYEQTAYWIDGALKCGYFAGDNSLYQKALEEIDFAVDHAAPDGFIGPDSMREKDRWPYAVFFRAVLAQYEISGDSRYLDAMIRHYRALPHPMGWDRDVTGVEILLNLYQESGQEDLVKMAEDLYTLFNKKWPDLDCSMNSLLSDKAQTEHGVTFNEEAKLVAMLYSATGNKEYLRAVVHGYEKLDKNAGLADGLHSSSEHIHGKESRDMHETCDITDYTWALAYLLQATGDAKYADKIEQVIFNALPGSITKDFHAMQYFSCPNQVIATSTSNHNFFMHGLNWMSYRPDHEVQCCPGNIHRAMPNFVSKMWMRTVDSGIAAVLYGPGSLETRVGKKETSVNLKAETRYPYQQAVEFFVQSAEPVSFPMSFRIPTWCTRARLAVNHQDIDAELSPGTFFTIERLWQPGDIVKLDLPFDLRADQWPGNGVSLRYGPLTLAFPIPTRAEIEKVNSTTLQRQDTLGKQYEERKVVVKQDFPAWNLYPSGPWNYALGMDEGDLKDVKVEWNEKCDDPLDASNPAFTVRVKARRVSGWHLTHTHKAKQFGHWVDADGKFCRGIRTISGDFKYTPPLPEPQTLQSKLSKVVEEIELIPYGSTNLRITVFPKA